MTIAAAAALATAGLLWGAAPVAATSFDLLYLKSNVGESAGGHSAIRFGDDVYHFQNDDGALLRLRRTPDRRFRWTYAVLQNRSIHVARVGVPGDVRTRLHDAFNRRFLLHEAHARVLRAHERDRDLLDALIAADGVGPVPFPVDGGGLFAPATEATAAPAPLAAVRTRIDATRGPTFRRERRAALRAQIQTLDLAAPAPPPTVDKRRHPRPALRASERYELLALQIAALDVLDHPRPLAPNVLRDDATVPGLALSPALRRQLTRFAAHTEDRLVAMVGAEDGAWGFPMLLGLARLVAIDASLAAGRLIVLDGFPADAHTINRAAVARRHAFIAELAAEAETRLDERRARFRSADPAGEREYRALEAAASRRIELWRGATRGTPVRTSATPLVPAPAATVPGLPIPTESAARLRTAHAAATAAQEDYANELQGTFGYHLFRANCATEILTLIQTTLGPDETRRVLGGDIAPTGGLHFVPALAHRAALRTWNVTDSGEVVSFRRSRLDAMPLGAHLRESNRLTSTLYRPNDADAPFLFFTDDTVPARPLLGLANLAVGTGQTLWGTLRAPFDAGAAFRAGVSSVVFSLPELFWVNIRKGTFEYGLDRVDALGRGIDEPSTAAAP